MAGMFGSQYNDTKVMMDDLSNLSQMYSQAKPTSEEGIMKAPKGEKVDAGSWWAWLSGVTRQKTQEKIKQVQEELSAMGVDTRGLSSEYQQSLLEGIEQAKSYRDKWNITTALGDAPNMLEEQGVFPQTSVEQPVGVTEEALDAGATPEKPSLMDRAISMFTPSEPEPDSVDTSEPKTGLMEKPMSDDDMGLTSSPSQIEELKGLYAKKGKAYKDSQIVSHSYVKDAIVEGGVRGNSRVHGDASIETQNTVIDRIVTKGREEGLTDRQIAMTLAIAKHESGFNPDAAAGTTSARGLGQFVNKTGKAYGITKDNQWDLDTQVDALIAHTKDNYKLADGKDEAYVYAYHHDGPSLKYGGLKISKNKVIPLVDKFEKYLKGKGELQDIDLPEPDRSRTSSPRPMLRPE